MNQCCGAQPFFLGSGSREKNSAPAPPIKAWLRPAPAPKKDFDTNQLKNLNFNFKNGSINLDFVPKTEKRRKNRFTQSQKMYLVLYLTVGRVNKYYLVSKNMYSIQ